MKQRQKIINFLAVFVILFGGLFLILPKTSFASGCTATVTCGSSGVTCSCSGYSCGFTSGGCYASSTSGAISCTCPSGHQQ